ncbi:MAG: molybdopterin molybdotransferase [Thermosediminibacterales bacterium]|nr:molybdopterin molybdotransferase [Thermosediminibacterales bacterium]MDK2835341.1 molybdopterin molybdotransferase [Thermosediminibacterales bacterium]
MTKRVYIDDLPLEEAYEKFFSALNSKQALGPTDSEWLPVAETLGRVTASAVFAKTSSPHYHSSAMDGIAVKAETTYGASETAPKILKKGRDYIPVDTGDPLPEGFDSVIMIEDINPLDDESVEITAAAFPWQHVRAIGEDIVATEMIIPQNHRIRPVDIAAMLSGGITEVEVRRRPRIGVIPTGTELVKPGSDLKPGDIIESNSALISGLIKEQGGKPLVSSILADDYNLIKQELLSAVDKLDAVIINAGSSAGSEDFTASIIEEVGEVIVHGVAIKPGKPVILGIVKNKPVIGLPGYPVSAVLNFELFAKPIIAALQGVSPVASQKIKGFTSRKIPSKTGAEEFVRVKLGRVGEKIVVTPISRGAGVITSLVRADGIVRIPRMCEGLPAGAEVEIELLKPVEEVENTVVSVGSHDIALDLLASLLKEKYPQLNLSSAHVGSMGGLMALKRGEAHMAGIHLLDEATGEYNISYLERYLPDKEIVLVNLTHRLQGIMVKKGNPKRIKGLEDLVREDVVFINRQRGAGTRMLLDFKLRQMKISPDRIQGYEREEYTHMSVAAAVAGGSADAGLGILTAARSLGLDFIPIATERYDLAIPAEFYNDERIQRVLEIIKSEKFIKTINGLGGYDTKDTGKVIKGV